MKIDDLPDWSDIDTVWLAGLLEGEGCFTRHTSTNTSGRRYFYPKVQLLMGDKDVVERAARLFGRTAIRRQESKRKATHSTMWKTAAFGPRATAIMNRVRPHMGARRSAKIDEILAEGGKALAH